jgi:hypothetical protein
MEIVDNVDFESNWEPVIGLTNEGFSNCFDLWDVPMGPDDDRCKVCLLLPNPYLKAVKRFEVCKRFLYNPHTNFKTNTMMLLLNRYTLLL